MRSSRGGRDPRNIAAELGRKQKSWSNCPSGDEAAVAASGDRLFQIDPSQSTAHRSNTPFARVTAATPLIRLGRLCAAGRASEMNPGCAMSSSRTRWAASVVASVRRAGLWLLAMNIASSAAGAVVLSRDGRTRLQGFKEDQKDKADSRRDADRRCGVRGRPHRRREPAGQAEPVPAEQRPANADETDQHQRRQHIGAPLLAACEGGRLVDVSDRSLLHRVVRGGERDWRILRSAGSGEIVSGVADFSAAPYPILTDTVALR